MRCLCCGKMINNNADVEEKNNMWHKKCITSFFGTKKMPVIDINEKQLEKLASDTVNKGLTVPGVQKKLSLHLSKCEDTRLTIVNYPTGYILKPQTEEYESLPEYEDLAMRLADAVGIKTVPHALIKINDRLAYITKRIDRDIKDNSVDLYAMEDFCQLSNRLTQDKYKGSYEKCSRVIKQYSYLPTLDLSELFIRVVFAFIIGNSDMHMKNFSLIEDKPGSRRFKLSKAYDMLSVNVIMPEDKEQLALTINARKRNIRKKDFMILAKQCDMSEKTAEKIIKKMCSYREKYNQIVDESYLRKELKDNVKELIEERIKVLEG